MAQSWWARMASHAAGPQQLVGFYVLVGGLCMLAMCWLTPPFQVPDEPQHYYRSYQLSRLEIRPEVRNGQAGGALPDALPALVEQHLGTLANHQDGRKVPQRSLHDTLRGLGTPTEPERQHFVEFSGSALYAPSGYLPQAIGMAIGRALDFSPLGLLYAGRCANALAAIALTAWALSMLSVGRRFALVVALLPMTQFMTASVSPDALTIAGGFLVAACVQRVLDEGRFSAWQRAVWLAGAVLLCAVKVVYFPILAVIVIGLYGRTQWVDPQRRRAVAQQALGVVAALALVAFWFWWRSSEPVKGGGSPAGVDPTAQIAYLREQLLMPVRVALRSLVYHRDFLWESMIGRLGWLNVELPAALLAMAAAALALSLVETARRARPGVGASATVVLLVGVSVVLIELALYIAWTPARAYFAVGVQGRYFTPMLPLLGLALAWRTSAWVTPSQEQLAGVAVMALLSLMSVGTVAAMVVSYSLF